MNTTADAPRTLLSLGLLVRHFCVCLSRHAGLRGIHRLLAEQEAAAGQKTDGGARDTTFDILPGRHKLPRRCRPPSLHSRGRWHVATPRGMERLVAGGQAVWAESYTTSLEAVALGGGAEAANRQHRPDRADAA